MPDYNKTSNGQIIQIARGDLLKRLHKKPLARGELFINISQNGTAGLGPQNVPETTPLLDLVTNTNIGVLFNGDLFAGANASDKVYALGSGNALKWGGILSVENYTEATVACKAQPNWIYLYNGNKVLYPTGNGKDINKKYVAKKSDEYTADINPGDLIFYSPVLDQVVTIHVNHSSDALTKINRDELISLSMQKLLDEIDNGPATLKAFLDGPVRHYQYLTDEQGWNKVKIVNPCTFTTTAENQLVVTPGVVGIDHTIGDGDGVIYYIPFQSERPGLNRYEIDGSFNGVSDTTILREGDLILSIPTQAGGVTHKHISLYGAIVDMLSFKGKLFDRADRYATEIWKESNATNSYKGDNEYFVDRSIKNFIKRLFETKVDVDPVTGKIISSQLPDFLLGAPKYQGTFDGTAADWQHVSSSTTAEQFAKNILGPNKNWENLDNNEDEKGKPQDGVTDTDEINQKLKQGCYWIYQGESVNISSFTGIFNLSGVKDDIQHGPNTGEIAIHQLNSGDWIIFNGTKFEVIDNTSSFVGIIVGSQQLAGVVRFEKSWRDLETVETWTSGEMSEQVCHSEETFLDSTSTTIFFRNPHSVLFRDRLKAYVSDSKIPLISSNGYAYNSRFGLENHQTALKVLFNDDNETNTEIKSVLFGLHKFRLPTQKTLYDILETKTGTLLKQGDKNAEGFDFWKMHWQLDWTTDSSEANGHQYLFTILREQQPELFLPQHSGTLATETYVNNGFTVIKKIINDLHDYFAGQLTKGHVEWLQTVRELDELNPDGTKRREVYDSKVRETYVKAEKLLIDYFIDGPDGGYEENTSDNFSRIGVYQNIVGKYDILTDFVLGDKTYNPSIRKPGAVVENILPQHSGVLLNNNSVIDCGEWY